jgi:hypothetical protein
MVLRLLSLLFEEMTTVYPCTSLYVTKSPRWYDSGLVGLTGAILTILLDQNLTTQRLMKLRLSSERVLTNMLLELRLAPQLQFLKSIRLQLIKPWTIAEYD